jgi:hypothetical protein
MTTTTEKFSEKRLKELYYRHCSHKETDALFAFFQQFKSKFRLRESFKIKGITHEFFCLYGDIYAYYFILSDNKIMGVFSSSTFSPASDMWDELIGAVNEGYYSGCPHYSFGENAKDVQVILSDRRFIEFHKIAKRSVKAPFRSKYDKIPGTPFLIGQPIMYSMDKDGSNRFFFAKGYNVLSYDLEYNIANGKRFNTKFSVISSVCEYSYKKALDKLIEELDKRKATFVSGHWDCSGSPWVWVEPNMRDADNIQLQIDVVKQFSIGK